jgi:hypothetical protein
MSALELVNRAITKRAKAVFPATGNMRRLVDVRDEISRFDKVKDYCGRSFVTRITQSDWAGLSAKQRYEVAQLSLNLPAPATEAATASASLFLRLRSTGLNASAQGSSQVSLNLSFYPRN